MPSSLTAYTSGTGMPFALKCAAIEMKALFSFTLKPMTPMHEVCPSLNLKYCLLLAEPVKGYTLI